MEAFLAPGCAVLLPIAHNTPLGSHCTNPLNIKVLLPSGVAGLSAHLPKVHYRDYTTWLDNPSPYAPDSVKAIL